MTLISHGLSGELKQYNIGCSTLWPRTGIATAAIQNLVGEDPIMKVCRTCLNFK